MDQCPVKRLKPEDITRSVLDSVERLWYRNAAPNSEFCRRSARKTIRENAESGIVLQRGTGIAGAKMFRFPWNERIKIGYIAFWFFDAPRDMVIFRDMCRLLFAYGVDSVQAQSHPPLHTIGRHYTRLGFRQVETAWTCNPGEWETEFSLSVTSNAVKPIANGTISNSFQRPES